MEVALLETVVSEKETELREREPMPFALRFMEKAGFPVSRCSSDFSDSPTYIGPTQCPTGGNDMDYETD